MEDAILDIITRMAHGIGRIKTACSILIKYSMTAMYCREYDRGYARETSFYAGPI